MNFSQTPDQHAPDQPAPDPLAYAQGVERIDYEWTDKAFELMTAGKLIVQFSGLDRDLVLASGECPRCAHDVAYTHVETIVVPQGPVGTLGNRLPGLGGSFTGEQHDNDDQDPQYVVVPVLCQCTEKHPDGPKDAKGCGIAFNTEILAPK